MNSQDFLSLQESYLEVVMNEELKPLPKEKMARQAQRAHGKEVRAAAAGDEKETNRQMQRRIAMQMTSSRRTVLDKKKIKEEVEDVYKMISSYLLDEGFASTEKTADKIILNMSESWFEKIVEARRSEKEGKGSPESWLSYPGRETQKKRGDMGGRHWQSGGEGGSKTERGRKKSDQHSQAQRLRGLSNYPEKPGKYSEMQRKRKGGDIGSRFD
jgi:hypothetical protein